MSGQYDPNRIIKSFRRRRAEKAARRRPRLFDAEEEPERLLGGD